MKISVIVPVYNVEKYLDKCLESIIKQTYKNLEIIIIDDGSTDKSGLICDKYTKKDNRIKVIHQENKGLGASRNIGLRMITGDFISFVDSDDFLSLDYFDYLYYLLLKNKADIVCCSIKKKINKNKIKIYDSKEALKKMFLFEIDTCVMSKLYKKEVLKDLKFQEDVIYEDILFTSKAIMNSKKIIVSKQLKYYYLIRNDSLSHKKSDREYERINNIFLLKDIIIKDDLINYYNYYYIINYFEYLNKIDYSKINELELKENQELIRKNILNVLFKNNKYKMKLHIILFLISYKLYFKLKRCSNEINK